MCLNVHCLVHLLSSNQEIKLMRKSSIKNYSHGLLFDNKLIGNNKENFRWWFAGEHHYKTLLLAYACHDLINIVNHFIIKCCVITAVHGYQGYWLIED